MKTPHETVSIPQHVCTIKDRRLANGVLVAVVGLSVAGAMWLLSTMLAGPWVADTLVVEGTVAALMLFAAASTAWSLSRALGCGRCHTPQCRCT